MDHDSKILKLLSAQKAISVLESTGSLSKEQLESLTWAVSELTAELLISKEPLTQEEFEYGQALGARLEKRNMKT